MLLFIGSFALKFTQGETAPPPKEQIVPVAVRMQILNGCGVAGIAGKFKKYLGESARPEFIVDVVDERNFVSFKQEKTLLIARKQNLEQAGKLARKLGLSEEQVAAKPLDDNLFDVEYSLVIGADYDKYLSKKVSGN